MSIFHITLPSSEKSKASDKLRTTQQTLVALLDAQKLEYETIEEYKLDIVGDFRELVSQITGEDQEDLSNELSSFLDELTIMLGTGHLDLHENIISNVGRVNSDMSIEATFEIIRVILNKGLIKEFESYSDIHSWLETHGKNIPDLVNVVKLMLNQGDIDSSESSKTNSDVLDLLSKQVDKDDHLRSEINSLTTKKNNDGDPKRNAEVLSLFVLFIHAAYMYMQFFRSLKEGKTTRIDPLSKRTKTFGEKKAEVPNPVVSLPILLQGMIEGYQTSVDPEDEEVNVENVYGAAFEVFKDIFYALKATDILAQLESQEVRSIITEVFDEMVRPEFKRNVGESGVIRKEILLPYMTNALPRIYEKLRIQEGASTEEVHKKNIEIYNLIKISLIQKIQETIIRHGVNTAEAHKTCAWLGHAEEISGPKKPVSKLTFEV